MGESFFCVYNFGKVRSSYFYLVFVCAIQGLHNKRQQILEDMKKIASSERGFKKYKEKLRNVDPPCVPFLGMYMTWIVFIKDGNEDKIHGMPDNFINFKKRYNYSFFFVLF